MSDLEPIIRSEAKRRGVTLEIRPAAIATTIVGDRVQIQQVLINLVLNAMDAVADEPEVRRTVVVSLRGVRVAPSSRCAIAVEASRLST